MLRLIKKLLHISSKISGESYLQVLESGDKKISFLLRFNSLEEVNQILLELIQVQHTKNCQVVAYQSKQSVLDVVVEICFSSKKKNTQEVCKMITDILSKEQEIKENGKDYRES